MMHFDLWLLITAVLLLASVLAWKVANRLNIPALLLFLSIGMLAGSDGPGGIYFDNAFVAQSIGVVALIFILFAGGLGTNWKWVRPVLAPALTLSTLGVLLTALVIALFSVLILHVPFLEGLLIGSIISATDAAAVFSVMGANNLQLKGKILPLLELESGLNDPMSVFLTLGLIELIANPQQSLWSILLLFIEQMGIGAICGLVLGRASALLISRTHFEVEGLYPVLTIALALLTYSLTATLGGSGFLAVYLLGLIMGNSTIQGIDLLARFHDGLAWVMQIGMFLVLGLLVFPSHLLSVTISGLLITAVAIFIARPMSVLLTLIPFQIPFRSKLFISWVGLRGAVPIVLATFPLLAHSTDSTFIFDLVFFIVLASVLLQGTTVSPVAKWLGVVDDLSPEKVSAS